MCQNQNHHIYYNLPTFIWSLSLVSSQRQAYDWQLIAVSLQVLTNKAKYLFKASNQQPNAYNRKMPTFSSSLCLQHNTQTRVKVSLLSKVSAARYVVTQYIIKAAVYDHTKVVLVYLTSLAYLSTKGIDRWCKGLAWENIKLGLFLLLMLTIDY